MISRILIANRGEIACRVIDTVRRLGLTSIAVYSDADADAEHVRRADVAVRIGPALASASYLNIEAVVDAAQRTGADAVHPGYGFLSENPRFAHALAAAKITFIGPPAAAIETMGDKISARAAVSARDVPVVPGLSRPGLADDDFIAAAADIGFPVLIKPSAGGGGKGMHRVDDPADLPAALVTARREAAAAFGDDTLFLEHFVDTPRHIEVQILADTHGTVIHLGERECSLQRRHQKVIEEAPSALLDAATRARIGAAACDAARSVGYTGAGTVEFIVSAHDPERFFFMEMNTRLQVEHPVTEEVTGIDLVEQQIRIADGAPLPIDQDDVTLTGHAVEARVYAEDPAAGFLPTGGTVLRLATPDGAEGIRLDSALAEGMIVGSDYDPMLAKVIAHGPTRAAALARLDAALAKTQVLGVVTNIDFCRHVLATDEVREARLDTALLDRLVTDYVASAPPPEALAAVALARILDGRTRARGAWSAAIGWRIGAPAEIVTRLQCGTAEYAVSVAVLAQPFGSATGTGVSADVQVRHGSDDDAAPWQARIDVPATPAAGEPLRIVVDGIAQSWTIAPDDARWWIAGVDGGGRSGTWLCQQVRALAAADDAAALGDVTSPMPGTVVAVPATDGASVTAGEALVVVEAMKMEHTLTAPIDGIVALRVAVGDKVAAGAELAGVTAPNVTAPNDPALNDPAANHPAPNDPAPNDTAAK